MKNIFVLLIAIIILSVTSICNASWWHDFIHSDGGVYEPSSCWSCNGTGLCSSCGGNRTTQVYDYENKTYYDEPCGGCGGTGSCSSCGGSGII